MQAQQAGRALCSIAAIALATAICAPAVGASRKERSEYIEWKNHFYSTRPFVQDALRRWAKKDRTTVERILADYNIEIMDFPTKTCVQFTYATPAVGGTPVYCYSRGKDHWPSPTDLIEEYSDVE